MDCSRFSFLFFFRSFRDSKSQIFKNIDTPIRLLKIAHVYCISYIHTVHISCLCSPVSSKKHTSIDLQSVSLPKHSIKETVCISSLVTCHGECGYIQMCKAFIAVLQIQTGDKGKKKLALVCCRGWCWGRGHLFILLAWLRSTRVVSLEESGAANQSEVYPLSYDETFLS